MKERRNRVMDALDFKKPDRTPKDLGGMRSTSVSCFIYSDLRKIMGLEPALPVIYDKGQRLAIPEHDLLDALDCDVAFVQKEATNAFDIRKYCRPMKLDGYYDALEIDSSKFALYQEKSHVIPRGHTNYIFPQEGYGISDLYMPSMEDLIIDMKNMLLSEHQLEEAARGLRRIRESTDRAIFLGGFELYTEFIGGMANGSMLCLAEPEYVHEYYKIKTEYYIENISRLLPLIKDDVDIIFSGNNDMGTQISTILSPEACNEFFLKYYRQYNEVIKGIAPGIKTFLHSCGAIYDILDYIIEAEFDVLNPVQWTAGEHSYTEWKEKTYGRLALWGGGIDSQHVLAKAPVDEAVSKVMDVTR